MSGTAADRMIVPVVLCGGSGTRLWPLSTPDRPKQLLSLVTEQTLLEATFRRLEPLSGAVAEPIVVCSERHKDGVLAQLRAAGVTGGTVVTEPVGRNSAPAVTIAALLARAASGDESLLLVLAADHAIADVAAFAAAVDAARAPAAAGYLAMFGVVPTSAATGYGYIRRGDEHGGWSDVAEFVEKPDVATAERYLASGRYLWNSGMFLFEVGAWLRELARFEPQLLAACEAVVSRLDARDGVVRLDATFAACPAKSIDYAVMERTDRAAVVPLAAGWSDVGSWSSVHDIAEKDRDGNATMGDVLLEACRNTYVVSQGKTVAAVGLNDVVVVATDDAVLVVSREYAEAVKKIAEQLTRRQPKL